MASRQPGRLATNCGFTHRMRCMKRQRSSADSAICPHSSPPLPQKNNPTARHRPCIARQTLCSQPSTSQNALPAESLDRHDNPNPTHHPQLHPPNALHEEVGGPLLTQQSPRIAALPIPPKPPLRHTPAAQCTTTFVFTTQHQCRRCLQSHLPTHPPTPRATPASTYRMRCMKR